MSNASIPANKVVTYYSLVAEDGQTYGPFHECASFWHHFHTGLGYGVGVFEADGETFTFVWERGSINENPNNPVNEAATGILNNTDTRLCRFTQDRGITLRGDAWIITSTEAWSEYWLKVGDNGPETMSRDERCEWGQAVLGSEWFYDTLTGMDDKAPTRFLVRKPNEHTELTLKLAFGG